MAINYEAKPSDLLQVNVFAEMVSIIIVRLTIFSYQACLGYPDITSIYTLPLEHQYTTSCDTVTLRMELIGI